MIRLLLDHAGLGRPRRFERLIAVVLSLAFAALVGGVAILLAGRGELPLDSPRGWYFFYLAVLVLLGLALAPFPRATMAVLSLLAIEAGIGMGSAALHHYRPALLPSALPRTAFALPRMKWHPLLQEVPDPSPPDPEAEVAISHNSAGLRGRDWTADELSHRIVIAGFGGSTTYDAGVDDGQTWGEWLERLLGPEHYAFLNHGVMGYSSAETLIQTAFYAETYGVKPACAIYFMGANDVRNSHIAGLDPAYADFHLPSLVDEFETRRIGGPYLSVSPLLWVLGRLVVLAGDTSRPPSRPPGALSAAPDPALEAIFERNIRAISAINRSRGIATIWAGQLMNRSLLAENHFDSWVPFIQDKDLWPLVQRLNDIARRTSQALGDTYADIPTDRFTAEDFVDLVHFGPRGTYKFATYLAPVVAEKCR